MPSNGLAVTVNAGGGPGNTIRRERGMTDWAARVAETRDPVFVFAQEIPSDAWLEAWGPAYTVHCGIDRGWRIRSALLVRQDQSVGALPPGWAPNLTYHGSYVAATLWKQARWPGHGPGQRAREPDLRRARHLRLVRPPAGTP